jgi:hypothetical protein
MLEKFVVEEPQETTSKTGEDEGIILKWILWKRMVVFGLDSSGSG